MDLGGRGAGWSGPTRIALGLVFSFFFSLAGCGRCTICTWGGYLLFAHVRFLAFYLLERAQRMVLVGEWKWKFVMGVAVGNESRDRCIRGYPSSFGYLLRSSWLLLDRDVRF